MPIPTIAQFQANTTCGIIAHFRRGSNLKLVDAALEAYWDNRGREVRIVEVALYNLAKECRRWLTKKQLKVTIDGSKLFQRRWPAVKALQSAAIAELAAISPRIAQLLRRVNMMKNRPNSPFAGGLARGYQQERSLYLMGGKTGVAVSGTQVHGQWESWQTGGAPRMSPGLATRFQGHVGAGDLSEQEWQEIASTYKGTQGTVSYLNKIERLRYLAIPQINGLLYDWEDRPFSFTAEVWHQYALVMWAMDRHGDLFVKGGAQANSAAVPVVQRTGRQWQVVTPGRFNHSSFMGGADVICAGCIHIGYSNALHALEPGRLDAIDNASGHYQKGKDNLIEALRLLREQGIDLADVRVGVYSPAGMAFYNHGEQLVNNPNLLPDYTLANAPQNTAVQLMGG